MSDMDARTLENDLIKFQGAHTMNLTNIEKYTGSSRKFVRDLTRGMTNMGTDARPKYHVHDIAAALCGGKERTK